MITIFISALINTDFAPKLFLLLKILILLLKILILLLKFFLYFFIVKISVYVTAAFQLCWQPTSN